MRPPHRVLGRSSSRSSVGDAHGHLVERPSGPDAVLTAHERCGVADSGPLHSPPSITCTHNTAHIATA